GNTFAVVAFQLAQSRPVAVAHHIHAAAQVIAAVRWSIPALVIFRQPRDAIISQAIRQPTHSLVYGCHQYLSFYMPIIEIGSGYVLANFTTVVSDLASVITTVNERFGTDFAPFEPTPENLATCNRMIDELNVNERRNRSKEVVEADVAR